MLNSALLFALFVYLLQTVKAFIAKAVSLISKSVPCAKYHVKFHFENQLRIRSVLKCTRKEISSCGKNYKDSHLCKAVSHTNN